MNVDLVFAIFAGILLVVGFIGTFVPVLPGAPLAWLGLLLAFFSDYCKISISGLIIAGIFAVLVSVLDNFFPVFMTKKFGGSKTAITGSTIGLIMIIHVLQNQMPCRLSKWQLLMFQTQS